MFFVKIKKKKIDEVLKSLRNNHNMMIILFRLKKFTQNIKSKQIPSK